MERVSRPVRNVEPIDGGLQVKLLRAAAFWTWIDLCRPGWTCMSLANFHRGLFALPFLALLGGCVTTDGPGSVSGTCSVFTPPTYAVRGATQYDQDWIDPTIEGGVGACHWPRPAARPAVMDAPQPKRHVPLPKKRPGLVARVKAKVWPTAAVAPVVAVPEPEPAPVAPPAAPRSAIDELLNPSDAK